MKLQKLYIKNFRGIKELFLDFQGKTTLLIGENDCCKTTILEAIDLCFNGKLEQEDLYNLIFPAKENNCAIACVFDENIKQDAEEESFNAIVHKTHIENDDEKISQSKYFFSFKENITQQELEDEIFKDKKTLKNKETKKAPKIVYYMPAIDLDDPSKSLEKNAFEKVFENLNNDEEIKKILKKYDEEAKQKAKDIFTNDNDGISKILEDIFKIKDIAYEYKGSSCLKPSINIVKKYDNKQSKDLSHVGNGVKKIIKFIARLKFDGRLKSIFLIDEPEQNLHPNFQKSLINFLKEERIQCIFASHSPTFVKHCMNDENCEVLICEKDGEKIEIKQIKKKIENNYEFLINHLKSQAVANFLAFDEYSTDLFIYIYEILKQTALQKGVGNTDKNKFESFLGQYGKLKEGKIWKQQRDYICHDGNLNNEKNKKNEIECLTDDNIKNSIDQMIDLLEAV